MKKTILILISSIVYFNTFGLEIPNREGHNISIENRHLINSETKGWPENRVYRTWEEARERRELPVTVNPDTSRVDTSFIKYIVLHYTADLNFDSTINAFYNAGVSSHYVIENDGIISLTVDPLENIAFHAGLSRYEEDESLNFCSIGIEHVNPGYLWGTITGESLGKFGFGQSKSVAGSVEKWVPFSTEQFEASVELTWGLMRRFNIPDFHIVTHADIAPGRKVDIGPLWDYETAAQQGVGFWPEKRNNMALYTDRLSENDYLSLIKCIGYSDTIAGRSIDINNIIRSYQMHYSPSYIGGDLNDGAKITILSHVVDLWSHQSQGQKPEYFMNQIRALRGSNGLINEFLGEFLEEI